MHNTLTDSWHSYPKVYALGHAALKELFNGNVVCEEKVDGSQFSFGRFSGELRCKSHHKELVLDAAGMFEQGVDYVSTLNLRDGWTYRGEYLQKPKHNTIKYGRVPKGHVVLFDVNTGHEQYLSRGMKECEAERLGIECVPAFILTTQNIDCLKSLLKSTSFLGDSLIEGIVIKNYERFGTDGKCLMGKFVSEKFKEAHKEAWKQSNPCNVDILQLLTAKYRNENRWKKAVGHLRDSGALSGEPKDIGPLLNRAKTDICEECADEIKEALWHWAKDKICRGAVAGIAEWYKEQLLQNQTFTAKDN